MNFNFSCLSISASKPKKRIEVSSVKEEIQQLMSNRVGILRNQSGLEEALTKLNKLAEDYLNLDLRDIKGYTEESINKVAQTGVDIISLGTLTHTIKSLDISLNLN